MRVTCRQEPSETGLARVCQSPRGFIISVDGKRVGHVAYARGLGRGATNDYWYWYAGAQVLGIPGRNSAAERLTYETRELARDACIAHVKASLTAAKKGTTP
jgi:hypothetical protein